MPDPDSEKISIIYRKRFGSASIVGKRIKYLVVHDFLQNTFKRSTIFLINQHIRYEINDNKDQLRTR